MRITYLFRDVFDCLTNYMERPERRVQTHPVGSKGLERTALDRLFNCRDGLEGVVDSLLPNLTRHAEAPARCVAGRAWAGSANAKAPPRNQTGPLARTEPQRHEQRERRCPVCCSISDSSKPTSKSMSLPCRCSSQATEPYKAKRLTYNFCSIGMASRSRRITSSLGGGAGGSGTGTTTL